MNLQVIQLLRQIQNRLKINLQKHVKPFHLKNLLHITAGLTYNYFDCTVLVQSVSPNQFSGRYKNTSKHSTSKNLLFSLQDLFTITLTALNQYSQSVPISFQEGTYIELNFFFSVIMGRSLGTKKVPLIVVPFFCCHMMTKTLDLLMHD